MKQTGVLRKRVAQELHLLAHQTEQLEYEKKVPTAFVPGELISGFCDDLYSPIGLALSNEFSDDELRDLAHLYGLIVEAAKIRVAFVTELLKTNEWRAVVRLAKEISDQYQQKA